MRLQRLKAFDFFYFTPRRVNLSTKRIRGLVYENGQWVEHNFPFPDVIYNDGYPKYEWGQDVIEELYEHIPRTSHSIGDKMTVYRKLKKGGRFDSFLIPSYPVSSVRAVSRLLEQYGDVVMKPAMGRQGAGVLRIEKASDRYIVTDRDVGQELNLLQFCQFVDERVAIQEHLIQPFIVSQTKDGNTYDLRLHVQKNGSGKWVITSIYPRIARANGVIPNLSGGGCTTMPKHFFEKEFGEDAAHMKDRLEQFALQLAAHMDDIYKDSFDELGIDVGLDQNRRIWLFELNWRPGPPPIWNVELDVARNSIRYAVYLAKQGKI